MMAERIHRDFTPAMRAYTRWLRGWLLFTVAHVLRYQRHPEFERVSLAQVVQAWRAIRR